MRGGGQQQPLGGPSLAPYRRRVKDAYARLCIASRQLRNRLRYAAPPPPFRPIRVDPADVERVAPVDRPLFREVGAVVAGDWDRSVARFTELEVYRAVERHFQDGLPWSETAFYARALSEIDEGAEPWGCASEAALRERCAGLDRLYERIAGDDGDADGVVEGEFPRATRPLTGEITVHIGRAGELLCAAGRGRLAVVWLLGVESVPVRVLRRHAAWQGVRDAYVRGEPRVERFAGHPDLADVSFDQLTQAPG